MPCGAVKMDYLCGKRNTTEAGERFMCRLTQSDKEKLGNAVIYIAERTPDLSKTKLLKLLYFMEERSVLLFQTPFLGLPFEVWQAGPVLKDVFIDLSEEPVLLNGYVERRIVDGRTYITAARGFDDGEFSDNDMRVMDDVLRRYGRLTARELVSLTHRRGGLWYRTASERGVLGAFDAGLMNNSEAEIDFSQELTEAGKSFYRDQLAFLKMCREQG